MTLLHVSTSTRSSSGRYIQRHANKTISVKDVLYLTNIALYCKTKHILNIICCTCILFIHLPDVDLVEVETCRSDISNK